MSETVIFITTGFWVLMLVDCCKYERIPSGWFWIVLLFYFPGALIYFFDRHSKSQPYTLLHPLRHWQLQQELRRANINAKCIDKAYQHLILGNILLELGAFDRAKLAYDRALTKEPKNPYALWGAASVAFCQNRFAVSQRYL